MKENCKDKLLEVKDKEFPLSHLIFYAILYENIPYAKALKKLKNYPNKINYLCKFYRKNNHNLKGFYCHAIVKRKIIKNYFI